MWLNQTYPSFTQFKSQNIFTSLKKVIPLEIWFCFKAAVNSPAFRRQNFLYKILIILKFGHKILDILIFHSSLVSLLKSFRVLRYVVLKLLFQHSYSIVSTENGHFLKIISPKPHIEKF
ncbi:hypothetical protein AAHE18_04G120700 [Arachis hypogaea]